MKSASRTLSFSVSFADCRERQYKPRATTAAIKTRAEASMILRGFLSGTGWTALPEAEDAADIVREDKADAACSTAVGTWDCGAAWVEPELAVMARPESVSRFSRCRSARMSAACW